MRLKIPDTGSDLFDLIMSPVEWTEVYALAKFAQEGIRYDAQAAYVAQVFVYLFLRPEDILRDSHTMGAFAACDRLAAEVSTNATGGDVVLRLQKEEMRQLLAMLGMAAESEDQADIVHDGLPEMLPNGFPDIEITSLHYAEAFPILLEGLHEYREVSFERPDVGRVRG